MKGFYKTLTCTHFLITEDVFVIIQSMLSRFIQFLTFYVACYSFLYSVFPSGIMKNPLSISFPICLMVINSVSFVFLNIHHLAFIFQGYFCWV